MKYFLDSNIFMYAAGRDHTLKSPCLTVLGRVAREELDAVTSVEVLQEILYRYASIGESERGLRLARLAVEQVGGEVLPVTLADIQGSFELLSQLGTKIRTRDAIHAATMKSNGISHIISADAHFDLIPEITRVDPGKAAKAGG